MVDPSIAVICLGGRRSSTYPLPISLGERLFMSGYALIDILLEATLNI
jgi:hypothetical protein